MLKGIRNSESYFYVSVRDPAWNADIEVARANGATVFELGTIPVDIRTQIQDGVMGFAQGEGMNSTIKMNAATQHLMAVRVGLRNFENFADEDGNLLTFEQEVRDIYGIRRKVVTNKVLTHFETWLINELGRELLGSNAVSGLERKNFNTQ